MLKRRDELIKELKTENAKLKDLTRWRSCEEELPPHDVPVFVRWKRWPDKMVSSVRIYDGDADGWLWAQLEGSYHCDFLDPESYVVDDDYGYDEWLPMPMTTIYDDCLVMAADSSGSPSTCSGWARCPEHPGFTYTQYCPLCGPCDEMEGKESKDTQSKEGRSKEG